MIQRIQTVYLLLVVIAVLAFIFVPFGVILEDETKHILIAKETIPLLSLSIVVALIAIVSIFLFNNRKLQQKIVLGNALISFILIGIFLFNLFSVGIDKYTFGAGAVFPIFILFFNLLAFNGIKNDDKLVKSMDRLR